MSWIFRAPVADPVDVGFSVACALAKADRSFTAARPVLARHVGSDEQPQPDWYLLLNWLPDYLVTVRHLTFLAAGLFASLPYFVFGVSEPLGGWIADTLTRRGMNGPISCRSTSDAGEESLGLSTASSVLALSESNSLLTDNPGAVA